ncbi:MAG: hypothetical protein WAK96_06515, partial [Desulfobaccales bacterium]
MADLALVAAGCSPPGNGIFLTASGIYEKNSSIIPCGIFCLDKTRWEIEEWRGVGRGPQIYVTEIKPTASGKAPDKRSRCLFFKAEYDQG